MEVDGMFYQDEKRTARHIAKSGEWEDIPGRRLVLVAQEMTQPAEPKIEYELWNDMLELWDKLKTAKPTERNEAARCYAVTITEFEKVMGYFNTFLCEHWDNDRAATLQATVE